MNGINSPSIWFSLKGTGIAGETEVGEGEGGQEGKEGGGGGGVRRAFDFVLNSSGRSL